MSKATDIYGRWPTELSDGLGLWSVLGGIVVGSATFWIAFRVFHAHAQRHPLRSEASLWLSRALLLIAAPVMVLVGLAFLSYNIAWGQPLWISEGAWLWPSAIVPLILAYLSFRRAVRIKRFLTSLPETDVSPSSTRSTR